jgi:hypothetical protein
MPDAHVLLLEPVEWSVVPLVMIAFMEWNDTGFAVEESRRLRPRPAAA